LAVNSCASSRVTIATLSPYSVTRQQPDAESTVRMAKLMEIKPHVKTVEAREAIAEVDRWIAEVAT